MKYYYQKPDICVRVFGEPIDLNHPVYHGGTLYLERGRGIIVTQKKFDTKRKECSWDAVDSWIANDIYTSPNFAEFFISNATEKDYPIFELRKIMWALRMKPLKKEDWELYF